MHVFLKASYLSKRIRRQDVFGSWVLPLHHLSTGPDQNEAAACGIQDQTFQR